MVHAPERALRRRRRALVAVKLVVTLGLVAWLAREILAREGIDALWQSASRIRVPWVLGCALLHFGAVTAGVLRWRVLLRARRVELPIAVLYRSFLVGRFVGAFTPSTTGLDGYRLWDVGRRTGDYAASAAVIVVEKLVGLVGMASVCLALLPFGLLDRLGASAVLVALTMAAIAAVGLVVLASPGRARALSRLAPRPVRGLLDRALEAASEALARRSLLVALAFGVVSHACLSATFAAAGLALDLEVDPWTLLGVGNAIVIAVLFPVSVGGVGVREGVAVALLASEPSGVGVADAVLVALLGYLVGQLPALVGGVLLAASSEGSAATLASARPLATAERSHDGVDALASRA